MSRKAALGCKVLRVTEQDNLNSAACRRRIKTGITKFLRTHKPKDVMIWASLPCTGGSPWQYANKQMPSGKARVRRHVREFNKLWKSFVTTIENIDEPISIAIEWPKGCTYWRLPKVTRFLQQYNLQPVSCDGCRFGVRSRDNLPIKKPWTIATNNSILRDCFDDMNCKCTVEHAPGREKT